MAKDPLTLDEVKKVAILAALPISDEEAVKLDKELSETVTYIDHLQSVDTKGIVPTPQVTQSQNVFREDIVSPSLPVEEALKNASKTKDNFFVSTVKWE